MIQVNTAGLEERISHLSDAFRARQSGAVDSPYEIIKTHDLDDGALMSGTPLPLWSRQAWSLYCQYFSIGVLLGGIPALGYPVFLNYLNMEGYEIATYLVIVQAGWYYKLFFGMLTDCVPICGYRRKPWILNGWSIAMICLAVMAFMSFEDPYCSNPAVCLTPKWRLTPAQAKFFNFHAPDSGTKFIVLSAIASFGYIIAGCASDAVVVEYSHREPLVIRGQLQTAIYIARYIGQTVAQLLVGVLLNGPNFKGSFSFNVAPSVMNGLFLAPCIVVVFVTVVVFKEEKQSTGYQSVNGYKSFGH
ncbi:hypothetical protein AeMF1_007187 [Aphanomyces euteiches]|nr:hypothetical protein AeMF1_007187 [Aphanomyces euteiches]